MICNILYAQNKLNLKYKCRIWLSSKWQPESRGFHLRKSEDNEFLETNDEKFLLKSLITGDDLRVNCGYINQREVGKEKEPKTELVLLSKNDLNDITKEIKRELNIAGDIVMNKKVLNDQILQIQVDLPYQNYCPFEKKKS